MTLLDQLKRDEGFRSKVYDDTRGVPTVGYGRNLRDKGLTESEAEYLLTNDISEAEAELSAALPWTLDLDEARRGVLLNMTFNMGLEGLLTFKRTLTLIQTGDFAGAADEMLRSAWAAQVGSRAERLSQQLRTGEFV